MKHKYFCFLLLLIVFLLNSSIMSARLLSAKQGQLNKDSLDLKLEKNDSLNNLMGLLEDCESGDEECFKRRFLADAQLDYIYTQHHNP